MAFLGLSAKKIKQQFGVILERYLKIFIFILVLIIFLLGVFILRPKYKEVTLLMENQNQELRDNYEKKKAYLTKLKNTIDVYQKIDSEDIKKINIILPERQIKEEIFTLIDSLAYQNGLILQSSQVKVLNTEKLKKSSSGRASSRAAKKEIKHDNLPEDIGIIEFDIEVAGIDYSGLKSFLSTLENNLRLMDVQGLSLDLENNSATMIIHTYYLKAEKDKK